MEEEERLIKAFDSLIEGGEPKEDPTLERGWYIPTTYGHGTYYLYNNGEVGNGVLDIDKVREGASAFWPSKQEAENFLEIWRNTET